MNNYQMVYRKKLEFLQKKRAEEQEEKLKQEFDVISNQSRKSFSRVSRKSIAQIRAQQRSISQEKTHALIQTMQPSFKPRINSPTQLYEKKGAALGLVDKGWTAKSHLQRLAEDLEMRK